jgi:hypothetical protein
MTITVLSPGTNAKTYREKAAVIERFSSTCTYIFHCTVNVLGARSSTLDKTETPLAAV